MEAGAEVGGYSSSERADGYLWCTIRRRAGARCRNPCCVPGEYLQQRADAGRFLEADVTLRRDVAQRLRDRGYHGKFGAFGLRLDQSFSYVIGVGPLNQRTDIHPQAGLRCHAVEDEMKSLVDLPESPFAATIGANVGYLLDAQYRYFEPPTTAADVLDVIDAALRVLDRYRSLVAIPRGLDEVRSVDANPSTGYRRVVAYCMMGDTAGMDEALERARAEYTRHPGDEIAELFSGFERRIRGSGHP